VTFNFVDARPHKHLQQLGRLKLHWLDVKQNSRARLWVENGTNNHDLLEDGAAVECQRRSGVRGEMRASGHANVCASASSESFLHYINLRTFFQCFFKPMVCECIFFVLQVISHFFDKIVHSVLDRMNSMRQCIVW
jgi:hypothetical protein